MRVTWGQALTWRLHRQLLRPRPPLGAAAVVTALCGVQAQVPAAARLAVAARQAVPAPDSVDDALERRDLFRTWAMRGTLHLLPADTAADVLALLAAARSWERGSWQRSFADAATMEALADTVGALLDGPPLTREEIVAQVGRRHDAALAERLRSGWSTLFKPLAWQGLLCQGPARGSRVTFTRPDRWVPGWRGLPDPDEAAARVLRGYLAGYGPATARAFDQWLLRGATRRADLRRWLEALGPEVVSVDVDGRAALLLAEHAGELLDTRAEPSVRLLPAFDQYLLGPGTTDEAVVDAAHRPLVSRAGGWISAVVLVDGRAVGSWQEDDGVLTVSPFPGAAAPPARALAAEASWLEAALGRALQVRTQGGGGGAVSAAPRSSGRRPGRAGGPAR